MGALIRLECETLPYSIVIEDDDKVVYAYLLHNDLIVGDVWLSNRIPAPVEPEWRDRRKAPFANALGYTVDSAAMRVVDIAGIRASWIVKGDGLSQVELYTDNDLLAVLAPGMKPGYCRNATRDGPLAKVIPES